MRSVGCALSRLPERPRQHELRAFALRHLGRDGAFPLGILLARKLPSGGCERAASGAPV